MNYNTISSVQCIFDIIDRYGIKSEDFVTRTPAWIANCLDDLSIRESLVTKPYKTRFNNNRCLLPEFTKNVDMVVINGHRCDYNDSLYIVDDNTNLNREAIFKGNYLIDNDINLSSIDNDGEIDGEFISSNMPYFYKIENGWLKTNVKFGTIEIICGVRETVLDSIIGLEFPIIPDEFNTKEAIIMFILKTLLMRGYIHPILSLKDNNPLVNPGLMYIKYKGLSEVEIASPNIDARKKYSYPMATLHGIRKPLYIKQKDSISTFKNNSFRGDNDNSGGSGGSGGSNNDNSTHLGEKQLRISTGQTYGNPTIVARVLNTPITLNVPIVEGFNYFFISIPKSDSKIIRNILNMDVTSEFTFINDDIVPGYDDNYIWKYSIKFYTGSPNTFTLTLS